MDGMMNVSGMGVGLPLNFIDYGFRVRVLVG